MRKIQSKDSSAAMMSLSLNAFLLQSVCLLFLLLIFSLSLAGCAPSQDICKRVRDVPKDECATLRSFYETTGGPDWKDARGWLEAVQVCSWHGIRCEQGHVTEMALNFNDLTGHLDQDLSELSSLRLLSLYYYELDGHLPDWLGEMKSLEVLILHNNRFECPIPASLGDMSSLILLDLDGNNLIGSLPVSLGMLKELHTVKLRAN